MSFQHSQFLRILIDYLYWRINNVVGRDIFPINGVVLWKGWNAKIYDNIDRDLTYSQISRDGISSMIVCAFGNCLTYDTNCCSWGINLGDKCKIVNCFLIITTSFQIDCSKPMKIIQQWGFKQSFLGLTVTISITI